MARLTMKQLDEVKKKYGVDRLYSWSRVHCFQVSPYEYFLKYVKKQNEDRADCIYVHTGGLAHDIIEKFYNGVVGYNDMINEFENGWTINRDILKFKFDRNDCEHDKKIADKYYNNLKYFFKYHKPIKHKLYLEKFITINVGDNVLNGYIDCCFKDDDGYWNIVDWKTSSIYRGKKAEKECGQLVLYAIGLNQHGVPLNKIKICWNFLKYCTVEYQQKNGAVKTRDVERYKLGESLVSNARMWLKAEGYSEDESDEYLKTLIDSNDIDVLPEGVAAKYNISDCYIWVPLTQKLVDKWTNDIIATINDIEAREKDYEETKNDRVFWDDEASVEKESFYFATLCSYSALLHKPYSEYLDKLEAKNNGTDMFGGIGADVDNEGQPVKTACDNNDADLSWLDDLL